MSIAFRILLIVGAALSLFIVVLKVRKGHLKTADAVFWVIFAVLLVLIAVLPQIIYWLADLLGVQSPANLVFLILIVVLAVREFMMTLRTAHLRRQIADLTQEIALDEALGARALRRAERHEADGGQRRSTQRPEPRRRSR